MLFFALRLSSWEYYYPFRLSEWSGAHGEICVLLFWTLRWISPLRFATVEMTEDLENDFPPLFVISTGEVVRLRSGEIFSFLPSYSFAILGILLSISTKRVKRSAWRNLYFIIFFGYIGNIYLYFIAPIIGGPL